MRVISNPVHHEPYKRLILDQIQLFIIFICVFMDMWPVKME